MSPKVLKETVEQMSRPTTCKNVNLSLKEGVGPLEWKEANIIPLLPILQHVDYFSWQLKYSRYVRALHFLSVPNQSVDI